MQIGAPRLIAGPLLPHNDLDWEVCCPLPSHSTELSGKAPRKEPATGESQARLWDLGCGGT